MRLLATQVYASMFFLIQVIHHVFSLAEERPYHSPLAQLQAGECVQYGSDCMPGNNLIILKEQLLLGRLWCVLWHVNITATPNPWSKSWIIKNVKKAE